MTLRKSNVRVVALSCFYLLYVVIGASIFSAIEEPKERQQVKKLKSMRSHFLVKHQCVGGELHFCIICFRLSHCLQLAHSLRSWDINQTS